MLKACAQAVIQIVTFVAGDGIHEIPVGLFIVIIDACLAHTIRI